MSWFMPIRNYIFAVGLVFLLFLDNAQARELGSIGHNWQKLGRVLEQIADQTGIIFSVPESLIELNIDFPQRETHKATSLDSLLENFNTIILTGSTGKTEKVFILSRTDWGQVEKSRVQPVPSRNKKPLKTSDIWLNTNQLEELAEGPYRSPLPSHLIFIPTVSEFLSLYGISSMDDMSNLSKAIRIRVEARRQLKLLNKENSTTVTQNS